MADQTLQVKIEGDLKNLQAALTQAKSQVSNFEKTVETNSVKVNESFGQMESFAKGALSGIAAAFSVGAIINFGKAIVSTTAEFQKMEAVLTNTLGSNSAARVAMDELSDFASRTPFSVNELTSSFVKLANQGFTPTLNQLTSLGDLASSTGKSFDQLTEAIIDAQVGEFERLKEFGVRAAKEGDNVTFTFKGVETQVKSTDEAIRGYILGLGDAEGVTGSMAAISETVGGKISNLGDNFTQLQKEIGDGSSGLISGVLDLANAMTNQLVTSLNAVNTIARQTGENGFVSFFKQISALVNPAYAQSLQIQADVIKAIDKASLDASVSIEKQAEKLDRVKILTDDIKRLESQRDGSSNEAVKKSFSERIDLLKKELELINDIPKKRTEEVEKLGLISSITKSIKDLNEQRNLAKDQDEINLLTGKIDLLKEELSLINAIAKRANDPIDLGISKTLPERDGNIAIENPALEGGIIPDLGTDVFQEQAQEIINTNQIITDSFGTLGTAIGSNLNISNDAVKGFVTTVLSNAPKLISAIIAQAQASNKAADIANKGNFKQAKGNVILSATDAAKGLGPIGLAALPILIGGALALISGAFGKSSGGGGGGGGFSAGMSSSIASPTLFTNSQSIAPVQPSLPSGNIDFDNSQGKLEARIDGNDIVFIYDRTKERQQGGG